MILRADLDELSNNTFKYSHDEEVRFPAFIFLSRCILAGDARHVPPTALLYFAPNWLFTPSDLTCSRSMITVRFRLASNVRHHATYVACKHIRK